MFGERVLVIAAHPDDEVLGCGGLLAKLTRNGVICRVVYMGEGSSSRFSNIGKESDLILAAINERRQCADNALAILGVVDKHFYELPCGRFDMTSILDIGKIIEHEIENFMPDTVIAHSGKDLNNDHRLVFQATLQATRPGAKNMVNLLLAYEVLSSSEWRFVEQFQPNVFIDIEHQLDMKIQAMAAYPAEQKSYPFPRSKDGIKALAMIRGMQSALCFAEAYEIIRLISR